MSAQSLFEKVWASHIVAPETDDTPAVLYVDLHLIHEVTSPQAFDVLRSRGLKVRRTDRCLATLDHSTPTVPMKSLKDLEIVSEPAAAKQVRQMEKNCKDFGIELRGFSSRERGIVHVIGPELGASQPGTTIVCGDSHTSTHGALGALAFGIGTTEVGHVLATQCLLQRKPKTLAINLDGKLAARCHGEGRDPARDRRDRRRRRHGPRDRVPRQRDSRDVDGRADDRLQHVDRGRRARGHDRARRHHVPIPRGPAARAAGRRVGCGREALALAAERRGRAFRSRGQHRRLDARADGHVRHESRAW